MRIIATFVFVLSFGIANAQIHQDVAPSLEGQDLLDALIDQYKPSQVPSSSQGRDFLYGEVFGKFDNILEGVYSGFTITLNPNADPSEDAFSKGINLEHTFPKSKVTNGPAEQDLHNLFPTRVEVNSARGSLPFGEVNDNQADEWYNDTQEITNMPSSNIDDWSEIEFNVAFEPREIHKGNVARAMMYTYTMYKNEADIEDPNFFESQRETLCQWHAQDPADDDEWVHTWRIAGFQQGKPNPFVIDCTVAARTYCEGVIDVCIPVSVAEIDELPLQIQPNTPNPFTQSTTIHYQLTEAMDVEVRILNALGQPIQTIINERQASGKQTIQWSAIDAPNGLYYYEIVGNQTVRLIGKMIKL